MELSVGAVLAIFNQQEVGEPVLQVIDIKHLPAAGGGPGRYRLVVSDSQYYQQAMLATQLNELVSSGTISPFCIIRVTESIVNSVSGRRVVFVLGLQVLDRGPGEQIGDPVNAEAQLTATQDVRPSGPPVQQNMQQQQPYQQQQPPYQQQAQQAPPPRQFNQPPQHNYQQQQQQQHNYAPPQQQQQQTYGQGQGHNSFRPPQQFQPPQQGHNAQPWRQPQQQQQPAWQQERIPDDYDEHDAAPAPYARGGFGGGGGGRPMGEHFHPIASLNPYQRRWVIKARVTNKTDMKTWHNDRSGGGKLFSVDLLDAGGGQIRATMFNDAADKFFHVLQLNQVYMISNGSLKLANKKFSSLPNEYELTLNMDTEIQDAGVDDSIQQQRFVFVPINELNTYNADDNVDFIGIVKKVFPITKIITKVKKLEMFKRSCVLVDQTCLSVELTFWGEQAEKYNEELLNQVVAIKACKISTYGNGRSLGTSFGSRIFVNPDRPEAHALRAWFDAEGKNTETVSVSRRGGPEKPARRLTFQDVKEEKLGSHPTEADWFIVKATVTYFRHEIEKPPWYLACPSPDCNKKVISDGGSSYVCETCQKTFTHASPRYILSLILCDSTGSTWVTAFNEVAEKLLGPSATQLSEIMHEQNGKAFERVFQEANFKTYILTCRAKQEKGEEQPRARIHIQSLAPLDYQKESYLLLDQIAMMSQLPDNNAADTQQPLWGMGM